MFAYQPSDRRMSMAADLAWENDLYFPSTIGSLATLPSPCEQYNMYIILLWQPSRRHLEGYGVRATALNLHEIMIDACNLQATAPNSRTSES